MGFQPGAIDPLGGPWAFNQMATSANLILVMNHMRQRTAATTINEIPRKNFVAEQGAAAVKSLQKEITNHNSLRISGLNAAALQLVITALLN